MNTIYRIGGHKFNITTLVLTICFGYVIGVYCATFMKVEFLYVAIGVMLLASLPKRNFLSLVVCFYLAFTGSIYRSSGIINAQNELSDLAGQDVKMFVIAKEDASYDYKKRLTFQGVIKKVIEPYQKDVNSNIKVSTFTSSGVMKGDYLLVSGKAYAGFGNNVLSIGYADVENIASSSGALDQIRNTFISKLRNSIPEPEASFAAGLLIGQKTGLSSDLQDVLRKAGLTHVIAVSGYNLTIIIRFIKRSLSSFSRFQTLAISYALILIFIGVTGMSPSILRAFIVSTIMLLSWYVGRNPKPIIILMVSMAISSLIEPLQLIKSVGWYLSFGAFFGVIILAPIFIEKLKRPALWKSITIESFCAGAMTLPIIAVTFKNVSIIGLIANGIVAPIVPIAMLLSLITAVATFMSTGLGAVFAIPTKYLLKSILDFADIISNWPGSAINVNVALKMVIIFYVLVTIAAYVLYQKRPIKNVLQ